MWYTAGFADKLPHPAAAATNCTYYTACSTCSAGCAANAAHSFFSFGGNGMYSVTDPTACGFYGELAAAACGGADTYSH